mgnify:CR=1 FL=1
MQILNRLYSRTNSPKALIYLFLASHAILLVMMTTTLPRIQAQIGGPAFDLRPLGYTVAEARSLLANLNPETIELYLFPQITLLDLAYPALLALFLSKLLFRIFHLTNTKKNSTLLLLPFLAMFFDYLENNAKPENKNYFYDYFYNNCATKIRDAFKEIFGDSIVFNDDHIQTEYTVRDLTDIYLQEQPWGDLGIDLCLGYPIDSTVKPWVYMFLPDYIEDGFNHAQIVSKSGKKEALVARTLNTYEPNEEKKRSSWNRPFIVFSFILILGLILSFRSPERLKKFRILDIVLFGIIGLLGIFLTLLWALTDHSTAAYNMNILWAFPLHFVMGILLCWPKKFLFLQAYFKYSFVFYMLLLLTWFFLPQNLNDDFLPMVILLAFRSFRLSRILGKKD